MKYLEIGPGDCPLGPEWDLLDAQRGHEIDYVARWGLEPLPIPDCAYDVIYASHVIEHIPWYHTLDALREAHRIIVPGGSLEIWTVDFAVVVQAYLAKEWAGDWDCGGRIKHWMHSIAGRTFAYEKNGNPHMWHKALFDREYLGECLTQAGFSTLENLTKTRGHDHGVINMGIKAVK